MIEGKKILILGGTGALGKTLIKVYQDNNIIRVLSRDEHKQVDLINSGKVNSNVSFMIGDVKDKDSLLNSIEDFKPDVVINAAAMKHVPVCENNPYESVNVNIIGHQNLLESVRRSRHKIETLIYISTDKACKPVNIYGMCKAISEKLYVEFSKRTDIKTCIVRYGNVLESTGSVIPLFKKIIETGGKKIPVTDLRMTRFLLTLDSAVDLIDWTYRCERSHGCISVPKISSFRVIDIARSLIKNYTGSEDGLEIDIIGIRKGEKLHEEMISDEEWIRTIDSENYLITDDIIRKDIMSINSLDSVMPAGEVFGFLQKCGVI